MPSKSYGQDLIDITVGKFNSKNTELDLIERRKMIDLSRKNNFNIGVDTKNMVPVISSQKDAYRPNFIK